MTAHTPACHEGPATACICPADHEHRAGCSHSRTGRCICAYLAQWDNHPDGYTAPTFVAAGGWAEVVPDDEAFARDQVRLSMTTPISTDLTADGGHRYIPRLQGWPVADTAGTMSPEEAASLFKHPGHLTGRGTLVIPDEMWDDLDPAALKADGSPEVISASEYQARQPAPFPLEEKDYHPQISEPVKALTVDGRIWEPRQLRLEEELRTRYWHKEYLDLRRRLIGTTIAGSCSALVLIVTAFGRWAGWF